jgi:hypothetical protein
MTTARTITGIIKTTVAITAVGMRHQATQSNPRPDEHETLYLGDGQLEAPNTGSFVKISPVRTSGMTPYLTTVIEYRPDTPDRHRGEPCASANGAQHATHVRNGNADADWAQNGPRSHDDRIAR